MKRKILIVGRGLGVGGIETAFKDFTDSIDPNLFEVSLLLFTDRGGIQRIGSKEVTILPTNRLLSCLAVTNSYAKQHPLCFIVRTFFALLCKFLGSYRVYSIIFRFIKQLGTYDIAISFFHDQTLKGLYYGTNTFVLDKVKANKKVAWVHSDYVGTGLNCTERNAVYQKFDAIVNVSYAMKDKFDSLQIIPKDKSFVIYNQIDNQRIKELSLQPTYIEDSRFCIVSVCRLDTLKSPLELCQIAKCLKDSGIVYQWHIIGDGPLRSVCSTYIKSESLEDYVYLDGVQRNPYPHIRRADLFVSGSVSETFGLSIYEALLLGTPVIAYKYDAISELVNSTNGVVVESFDEMGKAIEKLVRNQSLYDSLKNSTKLLIDYNAESRLQFNDLITKLECK